MPAKNCRSLRQKRHVFLANERAASLKCRHGASILAIRPGIPSGRDHRSNRPVEIDFHGPLGSVDRHLLFDRAGRGSKQNRRGDGPPMENYP